MVNANKSSGIKWKNRHCRCCGKKKSCGRNHLYVIELENTVLNDPEFCKDDREQIKQDSRFFYVGETKHRPECRYNQHTIKASRKRKGRRFVCTCENGLEKLVDFNSYNRPNRFVRQHHNKGGLRPDFYSDLNPICGDKSVARRAEKELAEYLQSLGHFVHYN